jgi:putative hemolysin
MEFFILAFLIVLNGLFSMFEIALVSSRKVRLEERARLGSSGAASALRLLIRPEEILSAMQVGITLIGIISGAYSGITFAAEFEPYIAKIGFLAPYASTVSLIVVVSLVTYFSLVIGELVPKTIALQHAEEIASIFSPLMSTLSKILYPIVWFLSASTRFVNVLFGVKKSTEPPVTEEELRLLLKKGNESGIFETMELEMISDVLRFTDQTAYTLMTPRYEVEWIDNDDDKADILSLLNSSSVSHLPLCKGSLDHIIGVVSLRDLLTQQIQYSELNLASIAEEPLYIPENLKALKVLELFKEKGMRYGLVVNEYGSFEGVITLQNIVEAIMGNFPEIDFKEEPDCIEREDGSMLIDGAVHLDRLKDILQLHSDTTFAGDGEISTLGGLAMYLLNKIPETGEKFTSQGFEFEVVDMDGNRVDKLLVYQINRDEE